MKSSTLDNQTRMDSEHLALQRVLSSFAQLENSNKYLEEQIKILDEQFGEIFDAYTKGCSEEIFLTKLKNFKNRLKDIDDYLHRFDSHF